MVGKRKNKKNNIDDMIENLISKIESVDRELINKSCNSDRDCLEDELFLLNQWKDTERFGAKSRNINFLNKDNKPIGVVLNMDRDLGCIINTSKFKKPSKENYDRSEIFKNVNAMFKSIRNNSIIDMDNRVINLNDSGNKFTFDTFGKMFSTVNKFNGGKFQYFTGNDDSKHLIIAELDKNGKKTKNVCIITGLDE